VNTEGAVTHYNVPNSNTEAWIKAKPKRFAAEIESKSSTCGYNFRRIIKMIKHWNLTHSDYLQSYHIEVLAVKVFTSNLDDTPWQIFQFFKEARALLVGSLWYDLGQVDDYLSWSDRQEVLKRFDTAITVSRDAWYAAHNSDDHKAAIGRWKQIFGDKFPAYG
jgi:hypothetical protein